MTWIYAAVYLILKLSKGKGCNPTRCSLPLLAGRAKCLARRSLENKLEACRVMVIGRMVIGQPPALAHRTSTSPPTEPTPQEQLSFIATLCCPPPDQKHCSPFEVRGHWPAPPAPALTDLLVCSKTLHSTRALPGCGIPLEFLIESGCGDDFVEIRWPATERHGEG